MSTENKCGLQKFGDWLFHKPKMVWLWTIVRVYVGYQWLMAGFEKITNPIWNKGGILNGFINTAISKASGQHADVQSWYAWFLQTVILPHPVFWSHVISYGELLVGIGLILGLFTILASFFGWFMNLNYLLAGAVSINPILLVLTTGILCAGSLSEKIGLDKWVKSVVVKALSKK